MGLRSKYTINCVADHENLGYFLKNICRKKINPPVAQKMEFIFEKIGNILGKKKTGKCLSLTGALAALVWLR